MSLITLFLKSWGKWIVVAAIVAGLYAAVDHYRGKADTLAAKVETAEQKVKAVEERESRLIEERRVLVDNAKAWSEVRVRIDNLARESATARAAENARTTEIAAALAAAKEGIKHAPGADDRFDFSDAAYGFVRDNPEAGDAAGGGGAGAGKAAPGVGGR